MHLAPKSIHTYSTSGACTGILSGGAEAGAKRQRLGCRRGVWGRSPPRGLQRGVRGASPGKILKFNPLNYAFNGTFSMNFQKNEVNS